MLCHTQIVLKHKTAEHKSSVTRLSHIGKNWPIFEGKLLHFHPPDDQYNNSPLHCFHISSSYDFYKMDGDRIAYNWMRLDLVLLMHQSLGDGTRVVPMPDLPEFFRPPNVLEGHPVPDEMFVKDEDSAKAKELVQQLLERDFMHWEMAAKDDKHLTSPYFHFYGSEGYGAAMTPDLYQQHIGGACVYYLHIA